MKDTLPEHIGEIVHSFLTKHHWLQRIDGYQILQSWEDVVPPKIALNTKPIKIQNNTLFIRVKNHIWGNELRIRKGEMMNLINKKVGKDIIKNMIIRIDSRYFNDNKK